MPVADGVGNGVHIHFSLHDASGAPVTYDPDGPLGLSEPAAQFAAGVLHHLPAIAGDHRAVAGVLSAAHAEPLGADQDRHRQAGSRRRVARLPGIRRGEEEGRRQGQFNLEFRVCDGAASPYLALGALLFAGADGIARKLALADRRRTRQSRCRTRSPRRSTTWRQRRGQGLVRAVFLEAYLRHKRSELGYVAGLEAAELCARYAEIY